mgnify:FL=1
MALLNQNSYQYYNSNDYGNYQFVSLKDIINQFLIAYVGENKLISKANRIEVNFHAQRALAELSFDTFKSLKSLEIEVDSTLTEPLPQDYVNYTKISCVDNAGIKKPLYPTLSNTSNPRKSGLKNNDNEYSGIKAVGTLTGNFPNILLDKSYPEIVEGMLVTGPNIPFPAYTVGVNDDNLNNFFGVTGQTEFILVNSLDPLSTITPSPTVSTTETLKFSNGDGSFIKKLQESFIINCTFDANSNKITLPSASDAANIEIGMLVSNYSFRDDTLYDETVTVLDIQGTVVTVSKKSTFSSTVYSEVRFLKYASEDSTTWQNYKSNKPNENKQHDYDYDDNIFEANVGRRYGIDPQHAQDNGSYYIDNLKGLIHFSSNISGKTIVIDYISDSLGTEEEMKVHKFAEEAMYKSIIYALLSTSANIPEYVVRRYKKEKFAAIRQAKLRLSNIKLEEITQIFRGKSKQIKH